MDGTPKGVTIHQIDRGLDTGRILLQKKIRVTNKDTLATTYNKLQKTLQVLFKKNWYRLKKGKIKAKEQIRKKGVGSYHSISDFERLKDFKGWDMTIVEVKKQYSLDR